MFLCFHVFFFFFFISEKFPSVSIPKLNRIDSLPSIKTCDLFERLTCNLFQSTFSQRSSNKSTGNRLERRTIDSTHISTISSLVDRTRCDSTVQMHESQKENFGLYALKCNRSAGTSKRGSVLKILTPGSGNGGSPQHKFPTNSSNSMYNFKHEHFQPCQTATHEYAANDSNQCDDFNDNRANEYYKIEFIEGEECINGLKPSEMLKNDKNCKNIKIQKNETESNKKDLPAPIPPRRQKSVPLTRPRTTTAPTTTSDPHVQSKATTQFIDDETNNSKSSNQSESSSSLAHQKIETICSTVTQPNKMRSPRVHTIKSNAYAISTENQSHSMLKLKKNKSELYRLADSGKYATLKKNTAKNQDENGNSDTIDEHLSSKRKLVRQSDSIFPKADQKNAFNDFDEVIGITPVVDVDQNSNYECGVSDAVTVNKSVKRVTLKDIKLNSNSTESFGNRNAGLVPTINISTDSNEIRIYSHERIDDNENDVAIVV